MLVFFRFFQTLCLFLRFVKEFSNGSRLFLWVIELIGRHALIWYNPPQALAIKRRSFCYFFTKSKEWNIRIGYLNRKKLFLCHAIVLYNRIKICLIESGIYFLVFASVWIEMFFHGLNRWCEGMKDVKVTVDEDTVV